MAAGRPSNTDPEIWFDLARTVDQNRATNEAFQSAHHGSATTSSRPLTNFQVKPTQPSVPQRHARLTPTLGNLVPMDVDAARRKMLQAALCFRCGKSGHYAKDCPNRFNGTTLLNWCREKSPQAVRCTLCHPQNKRSWMPSSRRTWSWDVSDPPSC